MIPGLVYLMSSSVLAVRGLNEYKVGRGEDADGCSLRWCLHLKVLLST
jgi:hypothetical protein